MRNFFKWFGVIAFFIALFFFIYSVENKQAYKQTEPTAEEKVEENNPIINNVSNIQYVKIAGVQVKVDLALTGEAKRQGLSVREELGENEGMLFVFDHPEKLGFGMKDMKFAIDIIWLDEQGGVVFIKRNALPKSYPEIFKPTEDSKYVLEVPANFSLKNNLNVGDLTEFIY